MPQRPLPPDIDDKSIPDDEWLYFRVTPYPHALQKTEDGQYRPASGEFKKDYPLSVDLSSLCTPEQTRDRSRNNHYHVVRFQAAVARSCGCRIVRDPIGEGEDEPANPAHALIFGDHAAKKGALAYDKQGKKIAYSARIVLINRAAPHLPDDVPPEQ
ncbi:MAG TPA: hypothetical protein VJ746_03335 [Nitrospira sp.]|nr:hypothetical protein [Nitrospira sp.]